VTFEVSYLGDSCVVSDGIVDRGQSTYLDMARCDARVEAWRATFGSNMGTITLYNSASGCPHELGFQNPWNFNENAQKGHKWSYTGNVNNYLYHVIHDEYEGHLSIAE
jgi:hypothetical protein